MRSGIGYKIIMDLMHNDVTRLKLHFWKNFCKCPQQFGRPVNLELVNPVNLRL